MTDHDQPAPDAPTVPPAAADAPADGPSVTRLAQILGLSRRTLYKMRERGAPADTDETAWRRWCHLQGVNVRPPLDLALDLDPGTPAAPAAPATDSTATVAQISDDPNTPLPDLGAVTSYTQLKAREDALHKRELRRALQREDQVRERVLIHRDEVTTVLRTVAVFYLGELLDLPARLVQAMPDLEHAKRPQLRRATEAAIDGIRRNLTSSIREQLLELLNKKP